MAKKGNKPGRNGNQGRVSNFPNHRTKEVNKVNGGVFVYTKALTVSELAEQLNVNASQIIKNLFCSNCRKFIGFDRNTIALISHSENSANISELIQHYSAEDDKTMKRGRTSTAGVCSGVKLTFLAKFVETFE